MKNLDQLKHDHHFQVSVVKSALRIIGCLIVVFTWADGVAAMALLFALAEILGVAEELV
jgi:hypothetical protein